MFRTAVLLVCVAGCVTAESAADTDVSSIDRASDQASSLAFHREHVAGDIYHYELVLPVGAAPNAAIRVHRIVREVAPFAPRSTPHAAMLLHGDFSTFVTNFAPALGDPRSSAPGLAPYLAAHDVDVWGVDRRWTIPGATADVSDFATMGVAQDLDDIRAALALARAVRLAGGNASKIRARHCDFVRFRRRRRGAARRIVTENRLAPTPRRARPRGHVARSSRTRRRSAQRVAREHHEVGGDH